MCLASTLKKILNHVDRDITAVYDRYSYDPEKRAALDAWAKRLDAILAGRDSVRGLTFSRRAQRRARAAPNRTWGSDESLWTPVATTRGTGLTIRHRRIGR